MKVLIVYESKYGNTKKAAEAISEGMEEAGDIGITVQHVKEVDSSTLDDFGGIIIGSPTYIGSHAKSIKKFINELSIKDKLFAVFDTNMGGSVLNKAVKKMEKQITKKIPSFKKIKPGLPVIVKGMKGPLAEGELPKCKEFGIQIGKDLLK